MNFRAYIGTLIFCSISLGFSTTIKPMIYASHLKTSDKKQVLFIGDKHNLSHEELLTLFKQRMSFMSQGSLARSIPFIVELDQNNKTRRENIDSANLLFLLDLDKSQERSGRKSFAFDYYDPRDSMSDFICRHHLTDKHNHCR